MFISENYSGFLRGKQVIHGFKNLRENELMLREWITVHALMGFYVDRPPDELCPRRQDYLEDQLERLDSSPDRNP